MPKRKTIVMLCGRCKINYVNISLHHFLTSRDINNRACMSTYHECCRGPCSECYVTHYPEEERKKYGSFV